MNISFLLTQSQIKARTKTVTRRVSEFWLKRKPGDVLTAIDRGQGFKKGEHPEVLEKIRVLSVRRERLSLMTSDFHYGMAEVAKEGFPHMRPREFVDFFCKKNRCRKTTKVTRIEFEYL